MTIRELREKQADLMIRVRRQWFGKLKLVQQIVDIQQQINQARPLDFTCLVIRRSK
jgi:hypothetical protein